MATTIILGDIAEGQKWWGTAEFLKTQLAAIYRQNNSFMHTWKQVSADTKIFCEMRSGTPWAFIYSGSDELYMESGFFNIDLSIAGMNDSANLIYNDATQAYVNSLEHPLQGKISTVSPYPGEQLINGMESRSLNASQGAILTKKYAQRTSPSSLFTGKTRLLVQALYGSKRTDYSPDGITGIDIDGVGLQPHWSGNTWLLTTDLYDYFLVKFYPTQLLIHQISLSAAALKLRDENRADMDRKIEAYILSTAKISTTPHSVLDIDQVLGEPLAHGWHTTWNGRTAKVVTLQDGAGTIDQGYYRSRTYGLSITPEYNAVTNEYTFTADCSVEAGPTRLTPVYGQITIIYPDYVNQGMFGLPYAFPRLITGYNSVINDNTPVYVVCVNDSFDVYQIKRAVTPVSGEFRQTLDVTEGNTGHYLRTNYYAFIGSTIVDSSILKNSTDVLPPVMAGNDISTDRLAFQSTGEGAIDPLNNSYHSAQATFPAWDTVTGIGPKALLESRGQYLSAPEGYPDGWLYGWVNFASGRNYQRKESSGNHSAKIFFEIASYDCESIFCGTTKQEGGSTSYRTASESNNLDRCQTYWGVAVMDTNNKSNYEFLGEKYELILNFQEIPIGAYTSGVDPNPYERNVTIQACSSGGDSLELYNAEEYSLNWHFAQNPDEMIPIALETWLATADAQSYKYIMAGFPAGEFLMDNVNFASDSAVGWVG